MTKILNGIINAFRLKRRTFAASPKPHHGASLKDFHSPSRTVTPVQAPPSPKPHYGASIKDYSPTRTETPPYPTLLSEVDQQQQKPLPSPPISIQTQNYQQQVDLPTPPPPLPPTEPDAEGWKEEVGFILLYMLCISFNFSQLL